MFRVPARKQLAGIKRLCLAELRLCEAQTTWDLDLPMSVGAVAMSLATNRGRHVKSQALGGIWLLVGGKSRLPDL